MCALPAMPTAPWWPRASSPAGFSERPPCLAEACPRHDCRQLASRLSAGATLAFPSPQAATPMKALIAAGLLALMSALAIAALHPPRTLEAQLLHLQLVHSMPETADELANEPAEIQALFLSYADDIVLLTKARLALLRYP